MAKLSEIAEWVGAELEPKFAAVEVTRVAAIAAATAQDVVFAADEATLAKAVASHAGAILAPLSSVVQAEQAVLLVQHPKLAFARIAQRLTPQRARVGIHPSAVVDEPEKIGEGTSIGPGVAIGPDVRIGRNCDIYPNVVIFPGVTIGDNCVVQSGAVLGSIGFGYVRDPHTGEHVQFPQQGTLVIEDNVHIGANTTIDRGALEETRIGAGTKIDNQVHIAHNCRIGKCVLIVAQVGISGSCVIEDDAILGGQVGLGERVTIGPGVILGGAAGVYSGASVYGPGQVFSGIPAQPMKNQMRELALLRRLAKKK
jgi:UDP-3-O-[3-hydroxymyristoyl] glucosamine N-acyltransferase